MWVWTKNTPITTKMTLSCKDTSYSSYIASQQKIVLLVVIADVFGCDSRRFGEFDFFMVVIAVLWL